MRISDWSSDVCSSDLAVEHDEFAGVGHGIGEPLTRERYHRTRLTFVDIPKLAPVIIGPARRLLGIGVGYFETGQRPGATVIGMNGHQMVEKLIAQIREQVGHRTEESRVGKEWDS